MVGTMAYRDTEVDLVPRFAEAASTPAPPDWQRLYEQALERAEAAEARAEELKWAEVAARSTAGSLKWQFKEARRKRLEAVEDANQARRAAKNALGSCQTNFDSPTESTVEDAQAASSRHSAKAAARSCLKIWRRLRLR